MGLTLTYNLGKEGSVIKLRDELEALKNYVALQRIRYDVDETLLDQTIPRFIL